MNQTSPSTSTQRLALAISPHFHNKTNQAPLRYHRKKGQPDNSYAYGYEWEDVCWTLDQIAHWLTTGKSLCVAALTHGQRRRGQFRSAQLIGLDLDHGPGIPTLLEHPFVRDHAFLLYYTPSSTPQQPRCRIFFLLDRPLTDAQHYETLLARLHHHLGQQGLAVDPACKEAHRMFHGSDQPDAVIRPDCCLPVAVLEALPAPDDRKTHRQAQPTPARPAKRVTLSSSQASALEDRIRRALSDIPTQGPYDQWLSVLMAVHSVFPDARGVALIEAWSPGYPGEVAEKFASFTGQGVTLRTLWHIARQSAVPPLSAQQIVNLRYISDLPLDVTRHQAYLIKSAMGTGKTELVLRLIEQWKAQTGRKPSVLVVTHRRSLSHNLAERLEFESYDNLGDAPLHQPERLTCTLNSLYKLTNGAGQLRCYDLVVLDEIEQQLTHLIGDTFKGAQALSTHNILHNLITRAAITLALDAHASQVAQNWLKTIRHDLTTIINRYQPQRGQLTLFQEAGALIHEIIQMVGTGKPIVIACDEKVTVERLQAYLNNNLPHLRLRAIHRGNSQEADVQHFIKHINEKLPQFDVLLYSPTLGTGIDIQVEVAAVFAFFMGTTITPEEMHQMLGRCRKANNFQVYLRPVRHQRPTDAQALYREIYHNALRTSIACEFDSHGNMTPLNEAQQCYLHMETQVTAARNQSMNNLVPRFLQLAQEQFTVSWSHLQKQQYQEEVQALGQEARDAWQQQVLAAEPVDEAAFQRAVQLGQVTDDVRAGYERDQIERALGCPLTEDILKFWDAGKGMKRLRWFIHLHQPQTKMQQLDYQELAQQFPWSHLHHYSRTRKLLVGILQIVWGDALHSEQMSEAMFLQRLEGPEMRQFLAENAEDFRVLLNRRSQQKDTPLLWLRHALRWVGLRLKTDYVGKKRQKVFQIDPVSLHQMQQLAAIQLRTNHPGTTPLEHPFAN